jgi:phosphatidate phosphatase APP1
MGGSWESPLPRKAEDHKRELIDSMLALYGELPFVFIGDSGQHDPEIYRQIVAEHPRRLLTEFTSGMSPGTLRGSGRLRTSLRW